MLFLFFLYFLTPVITASAALLNTSQPTANVLNGTYVGRSLPEWDQDIFLGIPFAQPPIGDLRFRWPQSLNTSFSGTRNATEYGHTCYQHRSSTSITTNMDEDCLTLNVIRPQGYTNTTLPILVWIYGGGLGSGSSADPQYNLSGIVRTAALASQPLIAISLNYRLGIWGFLQSQEIFNEGSSNAGLLDQRLALRWIQENIHAFGGDPSRVTIWGESAGAQSIGLHLHSFDGRNDGLYSGAIMESGGPAGATLNPLSYYLAPYENLTRSLSCWTTDSVASPLSCLRSLPATTLNSIYVTQTWNPIVDGVFLTAYPSQLSPLDHFVHVPVLTGTNTDEGTSFSIKNLDNETALIDALTSWRMMSLSPPSIATLLALYPDDTTTPKPPFHVPPNTTYSQYGSQWRRSGSIGGDLVMNSQRRKLARDFSAQDVPVWSYRFDTKPWNGTDVAGVQHFVNVVFSFQNITGALGPTPAFESYRVLSEGIGRAYAHFVATGDPNGGEGVGVVGPLPTWPRYDGSKPRNMVLAAEGSWVEEDVWREEGIAFINTVARELGA
ncbi:lipase [Saccharata proteae CBS 121410]|uniref:Carboxylic ester hydrolase n=1 Tax=Saccharata proteae CBS 121410 TaxID=1314787 RepID=A0A9P4LXL5_9PEZI|nr:lipase [Saccharata proteae CBS 121410]